MCRWCYRANYAVLLILALAAATVRRPAALCAAAMLLAGTACLSDVLARKARSDAVRCTLHAVTTCHA